MYSDIVACLWQGLQHISLVVCDLDFQYDDHWPCSAFASILAIIVLQQKQNSNVRRFQYSLIGNSFWQLASQYL